MYFGAHMSIAKGYEAAVKDALSIGADTFQFFTRNPRGGAAKALDFEDIQKAQKMMQEHNFGHPVAHAPYTINLAAPKDDTWEFAKRALREDIQRMGAAGMPYICVHPGSHVGQGLEAAIQKIARALNEVLSSQQTVTVLLEGMSGSGSEVGGTFQELKAIIDLVDADEKIGICLDTCHLFGAGYDVKNDFEGVLREFNQVVGIDRLKAMHFNDSLQPLGSHKDRHALLGQGLIGQEALAQVLIHPALKGLPINLETPGELSDYSREIAWMRSVVQG